MTIGYFKIGQKLTNIFVSAKKVLNSDFSINVKNLTYIKMTHILMYTSLK